MSSEIPSPKGTSAFAAGKGDSPPTSVGGSLWAKAQNKARPSIKFSQSFHTLRDMMSEAEIETSTLSKIDRLGEGAFAIVDKCYYQPESGFKRTVAVKRLKPDVQPPQSAPSHAVHQVFKSELDLQDFVREALLLKRLSHPCVVDFVGLGTDVERCRDHDTTVSPDSIFVVTEYMNRGTLYSKIVAQMKSSRLVYTLQEGIQWLIYVAKGMRYLHNSNPRVIHRDLKIENVMLTADSHGNTIAKIGDFGLHALVPPKSEIIPRVGSKKVVKMTTRRFLVQAKSIKKGVATYAEDVFRLSGRTGSLMYMAPEVLKSEPYNEKADVYSFAIVMYEVLQKCMLLAFVSLRGVASEVDQYIESVLGGFRPYLPSEWPREMRSLLRKCWADSIETRPTMDEIVLTLSEIQRMGLMKETEPFPQPSGCTCCSHQ